MSISDIIENFIIEVIGDSDGVEISRNELAEHFDCAPSQINYVLCTRFTFDKGFSYVTKRGNGGYVKIVKLEYDKNCYINELICNIITNEISYNRAVSIVDGLTEKNMLDCCIAKIMKSALSDRAIAVPLAVKDMARASILKEMLKEILIED